MSLITPFDRILVERITNADKMLPIISLNQKEIKKLIPHRGKAFMNLYHAIFDPEEPNQIIVFKRLTLKDHEFFGHLPGRPLYPGHWLLEFCNLAAILLIKLKKIQVLGSPAFAGCDKIRIKKETLPEDIIKAYVTLRINRNNKLFIFDATIMDNKNDVVATIENIIGTAIK
jgi:3-hydroxyacyl-[acyl-carrier-protein] dehydratase